MMKIICQKLLWGFLFLFACHVTDAQTDTLTKQIEAIITGKQANVGVAILCDGKELLTVNDNKRYALLSTFKFPVALAVLHRLDQQKLPLDTEIWVGPEDLKPNTYSPLRETHPKDGFQMSLEELLRYCISLSDNNACDILIQYLGGPKKVQKYVRQLGIKAIRIVATEDDMHQKPESPYLNQAKPSAIVQLLEKFMEKKLLSPVYQDFLEKTMIETTTGPDKLKGLLSSETIVGHKTGSSDRNKAGLKIADNDIGFVYLPNGKHYTIAVFVMDSQENDKTNAAIIARISRAAYDHYNHSNIK